jgi:hypothetical protein
LFLREEWELLHKNNDESSTDDEDMDNSLQLFKTQFRNATKELFDMLSKILSINKKKRTDKYINRSSGNTFF